MNVYKNMKRQNWSLRQGDEEVNKRIKQKQYIFKQIAICLNIYFLFYSFVYFFVALP